MPLDNFITRPDFSRQIKQFSGTTALLSGATNILQKFSVKNIEIDTIDARTGHVLIFNGTKFISAPSNSYGDVILNGMSLSYYTGLTYNISNGSYRVNGATYIYTGGSININSGNSLYSRFDIVYVTGDSKSFDFVLSGGAAPAPTVPSLFSGELQVGIISVPANFTGGTGSTVIQITSNTVFDYYAGGTGIQRAGSNNAEAIGQYSFALSREAKAYGQDSVAIGLGVKASGNSQTVVGQYNDPNTTDLFIVGNGTSSVLRANAFRVTTGGSVYVTNKLFVTNIEIETTGATINQALVYDGTKFKPQTVTGSGGGITGLTSAGTGNILILSSITNNRLVYKTISAGTGISIIESADGTLLFSGSSTSSLTGTSLGSGVKVLFSSNTTNLAFATLSSQTPSTLSIISSSTGLILFSADTTLDRVTTNGNVTANSIKVSQITGTSIFLSSGFTFISGYNSYSNPSELRVLLADDLGGQESLTDTYQLNYFTENIAKGINPLTTGAYSAFTGGPIFGYIRTGTSITVGKESFVKITGITSGDTVIGTVFRNRFETKNYITNNGVDDTTKNLVGTAFFNQIDSTKSNQTPFVGTLLETHLLGNQQATFHNEIRNLQLGVFNRAWVYATSAQSLFDLYINRPTVSKDGYNSFSGTTSGGQTLRLNKHAGIFIESREKISSNDVLNRTLITSYTSVIFENKPWSLFAEADRAYIGNTLVLASAQTLASTTRGAWLDIGASQATRPHINLSAGTDPTSPQIGDLWWNGTQLYFRKDGSTSVNLLSGGTGSSTSGSGTTSGTSLGDGVRVLFSSDTTSLSFATLSSQTPSTLRIISSSTGVILFSATTGSGGISGTYVSGITSAGTGNIQILSSITNNVLIYKTISAGTGVAITESNGTIIFSRSNTYFTTGITTVSKSVNLASNYLYDNIILTSGSSSNETITSFTVNSSISSYTPSIRFFAQTGLTVTFQNSNIIKTEGGLNAIIVGSNYDSITFEYNTATTKFYQTNINNYI